MVSWERAGPGPCKSGEHPHLTVDADGWCYTCHYARKHAQRRQRRASSVQRTYGLSADDLTALWKDQGGRCAGCGNKVGVVKAPAVDHDHALERAGFDKRDTVRGLLCSTCNRYLGHIGDDPVKLIRLAMYLLAPPWPRVKRWLDRGSD